MTEELEVLRIVTGRLESAGIPYMVTGSIAASYYAVPRMTRDIDLVVELSAGDADRLCEAFQADFYVDREAVRRAIEGQGLFNVVHTASVIKVDVVVRKETEYRREEFSRRRSVRVEGQELFIVAPEDLDLWRGARMSDTSPAVARRFRELVLRRSGEERLKMGCSMHATAKALVRASILEKDPLASPAALRQALFLRFYGDDFDADTREKVLRALGTRHAHDGSGGRPRSSGDA